MEVAEKDKCTEAMKLCESKVHSFFTHLDETLLPEESSKFKNFILANTFFAGGVFRSILSGTPVNDVDVFFKSYDAVIEFKHMVMIQPKPLFKEVTMNGSYNYKPPKGPKISFTTQNYGSPVLVIKRFDLSFNQHYYDMQRMEMQFDRDTFNKVGIFNPSCTDKCGSIARSIRFMNEGWKVDQTSILETLKAYWDKDNPFSLGSSGQAQAEKLGLIKKSYTEKDYFGRQTKTKSPSKVKVNPYLMADTTWSTVGPVGGVPPAPVVEEDPLEESEDDDQ